MTAHTILRRTGTWIIAPVTCLAIVFSAVSVRAGVDYGEPEGGWTYKYDGDEDSPDEFEALDGGWDHSENDRWDGSGPGEDDTAPGGIKSITEGDITYLRVQDSGDPRDLGFEDAVSNRKISLNRDLVGLDDISESFLDDGFTFTVRTRLATTGPLDIETFGGSEDDWPGEGRGYDIDFDGTGFFTLNQKFGDNPGPISFSLGDSEFGLQDLGGDVGGLIMNNSVGDFPAAEVDTHEVVDDDELNLLPIDDLTAWHEFWITIQASVTGDGTHTVNIYTDGSTDASTFEVTAGSAARFEDFCICPSFTAGATAVDIDFLAYTDGVILPAPPDNLVRGDFDGDGELTVADVNALIGQMNGAMEPAFDLTGDGAVDGADLTAWVKDPDIKNTWFGDANLDGEFNSGDLVTVFTAGQYEADTLAGWNEGDWDGDLRFGSGDLVAAFTDGGYELGPRMATAAVPEPCSSVILLFGLAALGHCRRRS